MPNRDYAHIAYLVENRVAHIVLDRPEKLNAMGVGPGSSRDEIARALKEATADEGVGAVLIRANGPAFCGGGDLSQIEGATEAETGLDSHNFIQAIIAFNADLRAVPKAVIVAVHGLCLGTALGFICQCDFVIAADDARFGLIEGRIGHPGASDLVPVIGPAWTKYLIYTGELIDARRAVDIGLALCVEPADELRARATELAERLARMPAEGMQLNKAAIEAVMEAGGRHAGRLAGRAVEVTTKVMAEQARAPDGRLFADILRKQGMEGLKAARKLQYDKPWLRSVD